jgi:enamine deaminase RidA (YjgF/YER057c/UK114 family)
MRLLKTALSAGVLSTMSTLAPTNATAREANVNLFIGNRAGLYDPAPHGYSHAVVAEGSTRIAYIAGQGGENQTGALAPKFADQVKQAYANLRTAIDAVGAKPDQVTKITTYVVDYNQSMLDVMTRHVQETFGASLPAQTLVPVPRLALDGMLFEVDAIAVLD